MPFTPAPTSVRVVVRLPWDRPETNALVDPPPNGILKRQTYYGSTSNVHAQMIPEVQIIKVRGRTVGKGLATHLNVPLPYLLYRVNARFQEEIRGLKDIQGVLSPSGSQPPNRPFDVNIGASSEKSPAAARPAKRLLNNNTSGRLLATPLGVRARLNSLGNNPLKPRLRAMSSSTLTLQNQKKTHTSGLRPATPSSSEGTDSEEEAARKEEEADKDAEEQEILDRKLQKLQEMITNEGLGLVSSSRFRSKSKVVDRSRSGQGSMVGSYKSYKQDGLSSSSSGSIPDIPSPPPESQPYTTIQRRLSLSKSSSPPALSPRNALGQRFRPLVDRTSSEQSSSHGSEASSFSDLSDADLSTSVLESALMSNIRSGGSRIPRAMNLTFVTAWGETYPIEIDPNMELENLMALLEAECGIPVPEQSIWFENKELNEPKRTMQELGVSNNAVLLLRKVSDPAGQADAREIEMARLQFLGDPQLMSQLREAQPAIAEAAVNNPQQFAELFQQWQAMRQARERELAMLEADPYNPEAQRKIEEIIRQQAVLENREHALEYSPESFGRVTMLYVPVEVNGQPVKAFVDSGAQRTIMTPECAERCGIMRLVDHYYAGIATGVGVAKILGRVHSVQLKLADLYLPCSITIMEGRDVDLLFGLDMLKAHQVCIDLAKNVLRIQGREVAFLPEHELPESARQEARGEVPQSLTATAGPSSSAAPAVAQSFPGSGNALGASPSTPQPTAASQPASRYPEASIKVLMDLGVTREVAIRSLDATNGDVDVAASLVFG
ncbi:hypothetical protein C0995_009151 [Termitomyces sp. Mi166|nr:hypothetical protein C0995_009151 [Termitomyces sp. Mi166\